MATPWQAPLVALLALVCGAAHGADEGTLQQAIAKIDATYRDGENDLYLAGYIHHGRNTYTPERIAELNENHAWGIGFGRTVRNALGNDETVYAMGVRDSHYQAQWMAGYAYQWTAPIAGTRLEVALGLTAQLMSRPDYFSHVPFPLVLPLASIGTRGTRLMVSYVPRLSKNKGSGDVLFFFVRIRLD
jgi:hypothetical protein